MPETGNLLTPDQQAAVSHTDGPCLVIAGAGTGKTKVITERIASLILNQKVDPEQILALTFTDKAATEMQERVDLLLPYGMFGATISTFHGFCHDLIKRHAFILGIDPNARLVGKAEEVSLLRSKLEQLSLAYYRPAANPVSFLRQLTSFIDRAKEEQITPEILEEQSKKSAKLAENDAEKEAAERTLELAKLYREVLHIYREANILTYADLIAGSVEVLRKSALARKEEQERFHYILVDEFQDTNSSQAEILYLLSENRPNLFVVGDDDQAIYRFRGANITNILTFQQKYPEAKIVTLRDNFRSTQPILDAAYQLIQNNNPHRLEVQAKINKHLLSHREEKTPVECLHFSHNLYEQEGVIQTIKGLIEQQGLQPQEIAILGRGHSHLNGFEQELQALGIPTVRQKEGSFYEQPAVERAISYLRFLVRPHDSFNLFFLLTEAPFNLEIVYIRDLMVKARKINNSLWEQLALTSELPEPLQTAYNYLQEKAHDHERRPSDILRDFITTSEWVKQLTLTEDVAALNALSTLYTEVRNFELLHKPVVLSHYLHHVEDLIASDEEVRVEGELPAEREGVQLMTIHASKGLEFRAVFVVNMVMDRFPSRGRSSGIPLPEELVSHQLDQVKYEEERRLAYVALTRAKELLFLCHSDRYDQNKRDKKPSLFIHEALGTTAAAECMDKPLRTTLNPVPEKEEKAKPKFEIPKVYSASALEAFETSPRDYLYEHVYRLTREDSAYASFGTCIHEILHGYFLAKKSETDFDITTELTKCWRSEGYESKQHEELWRNEALQALERYVNTPIATGTPERLEQPVELVLENGIRIIGKVDRIDRDEQGNIHIIDYKTGRKDATPAKIRENLPLAIYAAALVQRKEKVGTVNLHYVMTNQVLSLEVNETYLNTAMERVQKILTDIEEAYRTNSFPEIAAFWHG